jgi:hypothetical protein
VAVKIIKNIFISIYIMVFCISLGEANANYVPPTKGEIWDGFIPYDRRENCIQNSKYRVLYDKLGCI